jgi:hypothetical protein
MGFVIATVAVLLAADFVFVLSRARREWRHG